MIKKIVSEFELSCCGVSQRLYSTSFSVQRLHLNNFITTDSSTRGRIQNDVG